MSLSTFLHHIGMSDKESTIYHTVVEYHKTTASIVAQQLGRERTSTYKMMKNMVKEGFLSMTHERGTTFFLAIELDQLRAIFEKQQAATQHIQSHQHEIQQEYTALQWAHQFHTSVKLLSGTSSIRYAYDTIIDLIDQDELRYITCIATHTLESLSGANDESHNLYAKFFSDLNDRKTTVSSHLGIGMWIMEKLTHSLSLDAITEMPHANRATHIWVVWHHIFLIMFTADPQVIHIQSREVAGLLMFVAEQLER